MAQPFRPSGSRSFGSREGCAGRGEKRLARRPMTTATKEEGEGEGWLTESVIHVSPASGLLRITFST